MLDNIRMENIILGHIKATECFFVVVEISALLDVRHYPELQSLGTIKEN